MKSQRRAALAIRLREAIAPLPEPDARQFSGDKPDASRKKPFEQPEATRPCSGPVASIMETRHRTTMVVNVSLERYAVSEIS